MIAIHRSKLTGILAAACFFAYGGIAGAASVELAAADDVDVNGAKAEAQLWGDRLPSGYSDKLLVMLKDKEGKLQGAFEPSVSGGYNPVLDIAHLHKNNYALLSVGRGNWQADTEYRLIDFTDSGKASEIFSGSDNYGVVQEASLDGDMLSVQLINGEKSRVQLDSAVLEKAGGKGDVDYSGLYSLTAHDMNGDGTDELLTVQKITVGNTAVADVGAVWQLGDDNKWTTGNYTIMLTGAADKQNTINDGADSRTYSVLPRKIVLPGGEATYPAIACRNNTELQNRLNKMLQKERQPYLDKFYSGEADMAFKVLLATDNMLSVQLISGKTEFKHHHVHINMQTGEPVKLGDILDASQKDLLPLLNLLNTNKNVEFTEGLPSEWYIEGDKLFLLQTVCGKEEISGFALGNLHKFIKNNELINSKN